MKKHTICIQQWRLIAQELDVLNFCWIQLFIWCKASGELHLGRGTILKVAAALEIHKYKNFLFLYVRISKFSSIEDYNLGFKLYL